MKLTFITNSCILIELKSGITILCDPWLFDGAYEGTWANDPPLKDRQRWLNLKPDFIYISHIHPDHCDPFTLKHYPKDTRIIIGKLKHRHLYNKISNIGFTDIREQGLDQKVSYCSNGGNFKYVIHSAFSTSTFSIPDAVDYEIDTALTVVDEDGKQLFNCNDNPINPTAAKKYVDQYGKPDIALLPFSGAGLFPQCMSQHDFHVKLAQRNNILKKTVDNFWDCQEVIDAKQTVPLAGAYKLIGAAENLDSLTRSVGLSKFKNLSSLKYSFTWMNEGSVIDTEGKIKEVVSQISRPCLSDYFENDGTPNFKKMQDAAHDRLDAVSMNLDLTFQYIISINGSAIGIGPSCNQPYHIEFSMSSKILLMILIGKLSWNEAEIGSHIQVKRNPDKYDKTIHSLMNFYKI